MPGGLLISLCVTLLLVSGAPASAEDTAVQHERTATETMLRSSAAQGIYRTFAAILDAQIMQALAAQATPVGPDTRAIVSDEARSQADSLTERWVKRAAPLYESVFTPAEIKALADFYNSPVGQKMNTISADLARQTMVLNQQLVGDGFGDALMQVEDRLVREGIIAEPAFGDVLDGLPERR